MKSKKIIRSKSSILKRKSTRVKSKRCKRNYRGGKRKKTKRRKIKNKSKLICYDGIGANKSGKYNEKSFLKFANNKFKDSCGRYLVTDLCEPCITYKEKLKKFLNAKKQLSFDEFEKQSNKLDLEQIKCDKCRNKKIRPCNLEDYINYTGALRGC